MQPLLCINTLTPSIQFSGCPKPSFRCLITWIFCSGGKPLEILTEVDETFHPFPDENQHSHTLEKYFKPSPISSISQYMAEPNVEFISSHQTAMDLVTGKATPKWNKWQWFMPRLLVPVFTLQRFLIFLAESQCLILAQKTASIVVHKFSWAYDPSNPSHPRLIDICLDAEKALSSNIKLLYEMNMYSSPNNPNFNEWPHIADLPTPFLSALERMSYNKYSVIYSYPHPDDLSGLEMSG